MLKDSLGKLLILSFISFSHSAFSAASPTPKPLCNTKLEAFLTEPTDLWDVMQFEDLEGHVFDDEHSAANPAPRTSCNDKCQSSRISIRHIENKGIGYNTGYTTLEAFLAPPTDLGDVMPFVDLRGHVFDDGHWAANGGVGLRSLWKNRVYGGYVYYDYRDTKRSGYNQVSFGLETLGTFWDLRFNGYAVIGNRESGPYDTQFGYFSGNAIYYTQKFQYALSGGNAEVGFYPLKMKDAILYTGAGPYYLKGSMETAVWGGRARAKVMWKDYVGAELSYSYDHRFKNIVQGQVFLSYPLGPKGKVKKNKEGCSTDGYLLCQRMIEPVAKSEIIPVVTKTRKRPAVDPSTGLPYTIWFVNNLSQLAGTYENSFATLAEVERASHANDIIYVYPGDLTDTGLSNGVVLKDGQQLLGATVNQSLMTTVGPLVIPAQIVGGNLPLLGNESGAVVTLANNNIVSGFHIQNTTGPGILANGSNNATIVQNHIQGIETTYFGIDLENTTGTVATSSNIITHQLACVNINNSSPVSDAAYLFTDNTLHAEDGNFVFGISYTEGANNYFLSSNNGLYGSEVAAVNIVCSNTVPNAPHVFDVTNCFIGTEDDYAAKITLDNASVAELNIQNSTINSSNGIYAITKNESELTSVISHNVFTVNEYAFEPETHNSSLIDGIFANNSVHCYECEIHIDSLDTSSTEIDISNNTITIYERDICTDLVDCVEKLYKEVLKKIP